MAYDFIVAAGAGSSNADSATTSGVDTSTATLIKMVLAVYSTATPTTAHISDSKSNTWTSQGSNVNGNIRISNFYVLNPVVGAGHTFTISLSGSYPSIAIMAFKGNHSSPYDQGAATGGTGTSRQAGSLTPPEDNCLFLGYLGREGGSNPPSIDQSFVIPVNISYLTSFHFGLAVAYLIQTTAAARNPTWSWTTSTGNVARLDTWRPAAVDQPISHRSLMFMGIGR